MLLNQEVHFLLPFPRQIRNQIHSFLQIVSKWHDSMYAKIKIKKTKQS